MPSRGFASLLNWCVMQTCTMLATKFEGNIFFFFFLIIKGNQPVEINLYYLIISIKYTNEKFGAYMIL